MNTPVVWLDVLAAALALAAGLVVGRHGRTWPLLAVPAFAALVFIYCYLILNEPAVHWHTPLVLDFYAIPITWTVLQAAIAFTLAGATALAWRRRHRLRWVLPVLVPVAVLAVEYAGHTASWGEPPHLRPPRISEEGIVLQSSGTTCAAAVCANLARMQGYDHTEADMVKNLGTTRAGTTTAQIVYGMRALGIHLEKRDVPIEELNTLPLPAIAFVGGIINRDSHTVLIDDRTEDGYLEVWDPLDGKRVVPPEELAPLWSGHVLVGE
jgi:hypothetical protein